MWTEGRKILLAVSNWLSDLSQPVCNLTSLISRHERNTSSCLQELQGSVRESPAYRAYQTGEMHLESTGTWQPVHLTGELTAPFLQYWPVLRKHDGNIASIKKSRLQAGEFLSRCQVWQRSSPRPRSVDTSKALKPVQFHWTQSSKIVLHSSIMSRTILAL